MIMSILRTYFISLVYEIEAQRRTDISTMMIGP